MSRQAGLSITWQEFVESCAKAYAEGMGEREFGASFSGEEVRWSGGDYLFLKLPSDAAQQAGRQKKVGDRVKFTGRFREQQVFANVSFTHDREHGEVVLSMGLEGGQLIDEFA